MHSSRARSRCKTSKTRTLDTELGAGSCRINREFEVIDHDRSTATISSARMIKDGRAIRAMGISSKGRIARTHRGCSPSRTS